MRTLKKFLTAAVAAVALCSSANAALLTFDSTGDTGTLLFATTHDGASLNVTVNFTLNMLNAGSASFGVNVVNASTGAGQNTLMSFSVDMVTPTLLNAFAGGDWDAAVEARMSGGFQNVDLCVFASNGCAGGGINGGLDAGTNSSFNLLLTTAGDFTASGITFASPFGVKFQGVGNSGRSYEFAGCVPNPLTGQCEGGGGSNQVPEPATLALVGLGLLGATTMRRRLQRG